MFKVQNALARWCPIQRGLRPKGAARREGRCFVLELFSCAAKSRTLQMVRISTASVAAVQLSALPPDVTKLRTCGILFIRIKQRQEADNILFTVGSSAVEPPHPHSTPLAQTFLVSMG